ncbi:MAG: DNA mismatch repair protein MutS [bacterium]
MSDMTPLMRQYTQIKSQYKDAILFFRMGDFYEMFNEDAKVASRALQIALTKRGKSEGMDIPLCGIPYHAAESYIAKLIRQGFKVAVCEQVEDPRKAKGIVKREVIRVVTPGTVLEQGMLEERENHFLASWMAVNGGVGLSFLDLTTGAFLLTERRGEHLADFLLDRFGTYEPREMVVPEEIKGSPLLQQILREYPRLPVQYMEGWAFEGSEAYRKLTQHFKTTTLQGFGCEEFVLGIAAAGALLRYVEETQKGSVPHILGLRALRDGDRMFLDVSTIKNLELVRSNLDGGKRGTLLGVLDRTRTAMGGRTLRNFLLNPLLDPEEIRKRQDAVAELFENPQVLDDLRDQMKEVHDMERLIGRATLGVANARDLLALASSLSPIPEIRALMSRLTSPLLAELCEQIDDLQDLFRLIQEAIHEDPPYTIREGRVIRDGYSKELDELRNIRREGKNWIARLENQERARSGINNLKIRYNKVFGYYIEITRSNLGEVPEDYIRKQTLVNAERFITPELKEYEAKVLGAEERIIELEMELFAQVRESVSKEAPRVQKTAGALATLDAIGSLAEAARENRYVRPEINGEAGIVIREGRHPVIEAMEGADPFVPNDTVMDTESERLLIITGPNMAGKSTYMRQVALIVLMAQMGGFVPAGEARIGIVDRIFTRVGASDALVRGQSTFMVEMNETANILHNATDRSLIILDEIGRGTSTFDGISIAWAVGEFIHDRIRARTLFATHYHELTELAMTLNGVKNYNIAVKEWNDQVIFLRKIVEGGADKSYGIQVARLAGLPGGVIERAREVLANLEKSELDETGEPVIAHSENKERPLAQPDLFTARPHPVMQEIRELDLQTMTPLEALNLLAELKKKLEE